MKYKRCVCAPYLDRIKWIHYAMFHYTSNGPSRHMGHHILSRKCFIVIIKVHNSLFMNTDTSLDTMYRSFIITFLINELSHTLTTRISPKLDTRVTPHTPPRRTIRSSFTVPVYLWLFTFSVIHMADSKSSSCLGK